PACRRRPPRQDRAARHSGRRGARGLLPRPAALPWLAGYRRAGPAAADRARPGPPLADPVAVRREQVLVWHESRSEPPNLVIVPLDGSAPRQLTSWPDPHPQLTSMDKRLVTHDRGDGVQLSGMLHLPPGYDPACDGRLPLVVWA